MPATTSLIVDIETRHDTALMAQTGYTLPLDKFPPMLYHLPVAIAVGHVNGDGILTRVDSLQSGMLVADDPSELTQEFWALANHAPVLITFNGRAFDLPVLELCALRYGCVASKHWQEQYGTRYRYSKQHLDLFDILSNDGTRAQGLSLTHLVQLLGYQGKDDGMDGSHVQEYYEAGKLEEIQSYNRRDVVLTYAVYLQWARIAGRLTDDLYRAAMAESKPWLDQIR